MIYKNRYLMLLITILSMNFVLAAAPKAVTTFESIGLYWSPSGGSSSKEVTVQYREDGSSAWLDALSMKYNPIDGTSNDLEDYRGSIVNLTSNTTYEIKLTLEGTSTSETITATTWTEDFPIGTTINIDDRSTQYNVSLSGTESGYLLIDGGGSTIDVNNSDDYCINVKGDYVIIRGFTLKGAKENGIFVGSHHDIIIENCDISGWGREEYGYAYEHDGGIKGDESEKIIIQRCKIHHPRYDANSWAETNPKKNTNHPRGAQAIVFIKSKGNNVIRYNEFYSDYDHMFDDVIGGNGNSSFNGFPAFDSDIYGNYVANGWDDGIEAEGANRNVRIWGNYIENVYLIIGNASSTIGPLYVWGNTSGRSYSPEGSEHGEYAAFMKWGGKDENDISGYTYVFNNTVTQPSSNGAGGLGTRASENRAVQHCISRNNIFHVRSVNSISKDSDNEDNDFAYDLCSGGYPSSSSSHMVSGTPSYISGAGFDSANMTADYFLSSSSKGYDAGVEINNFTDGYHGSAPDMGAFESGDSDTEYGINAYLDDGTTRYSLHASVSGSGSVELSPSGGTYDEGTEVTVTATADEGWEFSNWSGDAGGTNASIVITMDGNKSVTANFNSTSTSLTFDGAHATTLQGVVSTKNSGYTGDGYANPDNTNGAYLEWDNVNVSNAGSYNCTIRYANGSENARTGNIEVNGSTAASFTGASTGAFATWGTETVSIELNSGTNAVRLTAITDEGLGNIDKIDLEFTGSSSGTIDVEIAAGSDDAEEHQDNSVDFGSSDLELIKDGSRGYQHVGMRFSNIEIPQGTTITNAYIQFEVKDATSGTVNLTIKGEDIDDAPTFVEEDNNISSRTTTDASVEWSPDDWTTVNEAGEAQRTPNLKSIIQEIVDRGQWASGNSIVLIVTGNDDNIRNAGSYDNSKVNAPKLHIEYGTPTSAVAEKSAEISPNTFALKNYPNPFNPSTNIVFSLPTAGYVNAAIYDITGRKVAALIDNDFRAPGTYSYRWNAKSSNGGELSSGIYLVNIIAGDHVKTLKITLIR